MAWQERRTIPLDEGWAFVQKGMTKLFNILEDKPEPPLSSVEYTLLYTVVYNMCTQEPPHDHSLQLFNRHRKALEDYNTSIVLPSIREKHGEFMLRELVRRWTKHDIMINWFASLFRWLDWDAHSRGASLQEVGLAHFRELIYEKIKGQVKDTVIALMGKEREGEQIDRALLKNVLDIFVEIGSGQLNCYENDFEDFLLKDTTEYYSKKARAWFLEDCIPEYMIKVEEYLKKEEERVVGHYLHISSERKLMEIVKNELIDQYATHLLENEQSGYSVLLHNNKVDDLARLYRLFSKIPHGLERISVIFKMHIIDEGAKFSNRTKDSTSNKKVCMWKIIDLHGRCASYVMDCFHSHELFDEAVKEAFEDFCNKRAFGISNAELLATFCDNILKEGSSGSLSDEAIDEALENVVRLVRYVKDKDIFASFYWEKLGRRLIFDRRAEDEHEIGMLTLLKQKYGIQFTSKMDLMLKDITISREHQIKFDEFVAERPELNPRIKLSVAVLTPANWPSYNTAKVHLPAEMMNCMKVFEECYQTHTKNRKLTWIHSLGTCNINAIFDGGPVELIVTTYQAALLLLFNGANRLSFSEIVTQLNLPNADVARLLHSLSRNKCMILKKEPPNTSISIDDVFEFNSKFTSSMRRIKITLPVENVENVDCEKKVIEDRRFQIDASIVRIMKHYKIMGHQQLVAKCIAQLSTFKPDVKVIKSRIESLIRRDFLERANDDANSYRYLA